MQKNNTSWTESIPLPTEMPKAFNTEVLKQDERESLAFETLIRQNQDLVARVGIALQRASEFEKRLRFCLDENQKLQHTNDKLTDENLQLAHRDERLLFEISQLTLAQKNLEAQFAENYTTSTEAIEKLQKENNVLSRKVVFYQKYRKKIQKYLRAHTEMLKLRNASLLKDKAELEARSSSFSAQNLDLQTRITDAYQRLQHQSESHKLEIASLTDKYELKLASELSRTEAFEKDLLQAQNRTQKMQWLENELVLATNKNLQFERELNEYKTISSDKISQLESLEEKLKQEKDRTQELEYTNITMSNNLKVLYQQVEALQLALKNSIENSEKSQMQERSLQRINQELSVQLNHLRSENEKLKSGYVPQQLEVPSIEDSPNATTNRNKNLDKIQQMISDIEFGLASSISEKAWIAESSESKKLTTGTDRDKKSFRNSEPT